MQPFAKTAAVLGVVIMGLGTASIAGATCVNLPAMTQGAASLHLGNMAPRVSTAYDSHLSVGRDADDSIVGMWQFVFTSVGNDYEPVNIPDGAPLDAGYSQWHSDGTEIMNSSRDPVTSSFCLGVWESVGKRTFRLNHYALSWDNTGKFCTPKPPATNCLVGPANIREEVTVGPHGNTYSGVVTIDQYDTDGNRMAHLKGTVDAKRITVD
jgi:hypothetical protein